MGRPYHAATEGRPYRRATLGRPYHAATEGHPYRGATMGRPYHAATEGRPYRGPRRAAPTSTMHGPAAVCGVCSRGLRNPQRVGGGWGVGSGEWSKNKGLAWRDGLARAV